MSSADIEAHPSRIEDHQKTPDKSNNSGNEISPVSQSTNPQCSPSTETTSLERSLGFFSCLAVIVGTTIGSGIFVSPTGVLESSGSVGLSLVVWVGCGLISLLSGLCYIELGLLIPKAGGEFIYYHDGLGQLHPYWGPLPAFLFSWMANLVTDPSSNAILAITLARYAIASFYEAGCNPPTLAVTLTALCVLLLVTYVNSVSISMANLTQSVLTVAKLSALVIIVVAAIVKLAGGSSEYLSEGFAGSSTYPGSIATAFYRGLWAYTGWNTLNYFTEEVKNPERNLPRAVVASMVLITSVYLFVNMAYFVVLSPQQMLNYPAVAFTFAEAVLGWAAFLVPLGVVLSTYGSLNGSIMSSARICFSSAREGQFLGFLALVHEKRKTPSAALYFHAIIGSLMIISSNIDQLIDLFSFAIWMFYFVSFVTLLVLRRTRPKAERVYRVPTVIPISMLIVSVYLVLAPIIENPQPGYFYVLLFMALGIIVHYIVIYRQWTLINGSKIKRLMQKLLLSIPAEFSEYKDE